jgi:hypothetical protein
MPPEIEPVPDLVAALHNGEINIDLDGHVDSVKGRIRNTFEVVPGSGRLTFGAHDLPTPRPRRGGDERCPPSRPSACLSS